MLYFCFVFQLCGRTIRVDHVTEYRRPKDEDGNEIIEKGCAPKTPTPSPEPSESESDEEPEKVKKKKKKTKKSKDKKKQKEKRSPYIPDKDKRSKQCRTEDTSPEFSRKAPSKVSKHTDTEDAIEIQIDKSSLSRTERARENKEKDAHRHQGEKSYRDRSRSHSRDRREHYRRKL